jgi:para-aminobenzoate synthetase component 1
MSRTQSNATGAIWSLASGLPDPILGWMVRTSEMQPKRAMRLDGLSPVEVAARLRHLPGLVFFDTVGHVPVGAGQPVSLIAARPLRVLEGSIHAERDRGGLRDAVSRGAVAPGDLGFPAGGLCGWIDYEGGFVFGEYPEMLVYRHADQTWVEVGGLSECLREPADQTASVGDFEGRTSREGFVRAVERAKGWIASGDIYQVNLSQAFEAEISGGSLFGLYEALRDHSPAPMAAWLSLAGREVLSSSPETFLRISGRGIETRPIKGTRPRFADADEDTRSAYELQTSAKEIAELVMITDLLRNDIGQVCEFGSVEVTDLLRLESLAQVHHLVSTVKGTLREGTDALDAVAACFPGGSITGAPKKRAMDIIAELEAAPRGLYCGSIGCFGFNGESVFSIAIRTLVRQEGRLTYHVGAGIVADSDPQKEYEETLHKAAGIRRALDSWRMT